MCIPQSPSNKLPDSIHDHGLGTQHQRGSRPQRSWPILPSARLRTREFACFDALKLVADED